MNNYFALAGLLAFLVGLVHSVLGERLVFSRMRKTGWIPTNGGPVLQERHVRILWASWHLVTVFGWVIAILLLRLSLPSSPAAARTVIVPVAIAGLLASSLLVLIGTNGKHPGWIGLLGVAILTALGASR